MITGKLFGLTNAFIPSKKCWVFQCMVEALANAARKTTEGLMDELGIPMDELGHKTSEHSCSHNISQSNELGPGDWYEDNDYRFAPGA